MSQTTSSTATPYNALIWQQIGHIALLTPSGQDKSLEALQTLLRNHPQEIENKLVEAGAILFRGFDLQSPQDFEDVAKCLDNDLKNNYLGTSPRNAKTEYVFSASELPPFYPIPQHCEMSFLPNPPRKLFFYCQIAPQTQGETPIVDFRKVYAQLDPQIREEFERKGIKIIRNYNGPATKSGVDFWKLKRWDEMFLTSDKQAAEQICQENNFIYSWHPNDKLRLVSEQPATRKHPVTKESVWYNHSQVFHVDAAAIEYAKIARHQKTWRSRFYATLTQVMTALKKATQNSENQAMHCTFLDGTEIPKSYMQHVEDVIWKNMNIFAWQKGDVIALDNFSTAHGRLPFQGEREILVAWTS